LIIENSPSQRTRPPKEPGAARRFAALWISMRQGLYYPWRSRLPKPA